MKLKFNLLALILILGLNSIVSAQQDKELKLYNLYYLSKVINSNNLKSDQINEVYASLVANLGKAKVDLLAKDYKSTDDPTKRSYIGNFLVNRNTLNELTRNDIIMLFNAGKFDKYADDKVIVNNIEKEFTSLTLRREVLSKKKDELKLIKSLFINKDSIQFSQKLSTQTKTFENLFSKEGLKMLKDNSFRLFIKQADLSKLEDSLNRNKKDSVDLQKQFDKYKKTVTLFATAYVDKQKSSETERPFNNYLEASQSQITINSIVQAAQQRTSAQSFNIPSESQMIEAMAIFLANRAKQETLIWFMDQVRERLNNPLVFEAFPETAKLLAGLEDYKTPNFSSSWRYAISSDFIKMPVSIAESKWVEEFLVKDVNRRKELLTSISFGADLNRLISERYNYRDIVRYFYMNPKYKDNGDEIKKYLNQSISMLYILTNELFAVDIIDSKSSYRLLSFEEINSLRIDQWNVLLELIELKYGSELRHIKFSNYKNDENNKNQLAKWMGNLLITLSQFDKINKDSQTALDSNKEKEERSNYNFYSVWRITEQIISNMDANQYLVTGNSSTKPSIQIEVLKDGIGIYEQIQIKNFVAAAKKVLNIIDKINQDTNNPLLPFSFNLNEKIVQVNSENIKFYNIDKNPFLTISQKFDNNNLELILRYEDKKENDTIQFNQISKLQPFFKYISDVKSDNYTLLNELDDRFDALITRVAVNAKIDKINAIHLLNTLYLLKNDKDGKEKIVALLKSTGTSYLQQPKYSKTVDKLKLKYQDQLLKLTSFFGDVLSAKDEHELANVIDSHALPPTSYKLKRRMAHSIDLNAYVGGSFSGLLTNGNTSLKKQFTGEIIAPIGVAFTWSSKGPKADNFGFTVDVIDLGNIVNHYLVSSTEDYPKDVHFSEVFSPSVSLIYGIRNSPFVLFGSVKLLPLKTIYTDDGRLINNKTFDATVFSVGVKIDIPLINLWSRDQDR
ncbi:hypothetical protein [Chryseobacterium jejuense]|uniref:Uncharacterized protein n=1 Tax=Chryseobacterium jejuense TaxID=445960 RepID=A0A2X2X2B1_CHRJE|nr:hypothetical protein [Chryseobacterium jejuense]SDI54318.1 hypothetical protein SAMN05421542_1241 [Chryseobacterium jejuense]SQB46978.1 Uncharacterised protein [Chryseobacterium jejuense]